MPDETATLPAAEPLTFQPFADIKDDAVLKEHTARSAKLQDTEPEPKGYEPMTLASLKKLAEKTPGGEKVDPPAPAEPEKPKVEPVKEAAAKSDITDETTDDELNKRIEDASKGMSKSAREHLKQSNFDARESKRQAKAALAEAAAVRAELEAAKKTAPDSDAVQSLQKEREALQKRIDEQESELAGSRVEKTQMFKNEIAKPMSEIEAQFKEFSSDYDVAAEDLIELASLKGRAQDSRFEDVTADWPKRKADKLAGLLDDHAKLQEKRNEVLAKAKDIYNNTLAQEREQRDLAAAKNASERKTAIPKVWDESVLAAAPFLKDTADKELAERVNSVRSFVDAADDKWFYEQPVAERVRLTAQAAAFPLAVRQLEAANAEIARLKRHNGELKGATPSAGGDPAAREKRAETPATGTAWNPFGKR